MKIALILSIFGIFILFNLYIRVKTMNYYRSLVKKRLQFGFKDMFNKERWDLVIQKYPEEEEILNKFRVHILNTGALFISSIALVLFLIFMYRFI